MECLEIGDDHFKRLFDTLYYNLCADYDQTWNVIIDPIRSDGIPFSQIDKIDWIGTSVFGFGVHIRKSNLETFAFAWNFCTDSMSSRPDFR